MRTSLLIAALASLALRSTVFASCGDGVLDGVEQCDDGNVIDGDCCSSLCAFESAGTRCNTDSVCWAVTNAACDAQGTCVMGEFDLFNCALFSIGEWGHVTDRPMTGSRRISLRAGGIRQGQGDPTTTPHAFCLFAIQSPGAVESVLLSKELPADGWQHLSDGAWEYYRRGARELVRLKPYGPKFVARGANLELPGAETPDRYFDIEQGRRCVIFALANADGYCGGATFCGDRFERINNTRTVFHAVEPPRD